MLVRFQGMNSGDREGTKKLRRHGWTSGAWYLSVRRRPGYSSSGCTPAEPDSASPGMTSIHREFGVAEEINRIRVERRFRRVEDWSGRPDVVSGCAVSATVEEKGRPGTRLRRIASGRKQTQVLRPAKVDTDRRLSPVIA